MNGDILRKAERGGIVFRPFSLVVVGALVFSLMQAACVGRPQAYDTPIAPLTPVAVPERTEAWPLEIALFNVWDLPLFADDTDERMARIPGAIAAFDPDVICLQEVWTGGGREDLAAGFGPEYVAARSDGGGLMVLSRLPILEERFTPFPAGCDLPAPEWLARKGMLEVVIGTPAGPVRVVNAHLALSLGGNKARTRQLGFLLDQLEDRRDLPLVLAADLNTPPVRRGEIFPDYSSILERGFVDLKPPKLVNGTWDPGPPTRVGWPRPRKPPHYHPDHILVRSGSEGTVSPVTFSITLNTPEVALSDHNLLLGEVRVSR